MQQDNLIPPVVFFADTSSTNRNVYRNMIMIIILNIFIYFREFWEGTFHSKLP